MIDRRDDSAGRHVFPLRVYYEDTDAGGVVYYANYLKFAERARTEMLRDIGFEHDDLMNAGGILFAVRRCNVEYKLSARLDDALEVVSEIAKIGGASLDARQAVTRAGKELVRLEIRVACLDIQGRAARLPARLRQALEDFRTGKVRN
jgi:acyl-CoA thioester hydrolase